MVGHSGILSAAVKACESVDSAVGSVVEAAVKKGWAAMITSDHGNAEQMIDPATNGPHTAHTLNPVPFILADDKSPAMPLKKGRGSAFLGFFRRFKQGIRKGLRRRLAHRSPFQFQPFFKPAPAPGLLKNPYVPANTSCTRQVSRLRYI